VSRGPNRSTAPFAGACQRDAGARQCGLRAAREEPVLRLLVSPTREQRLVDALLGLSRRRRRLAYAAIAGGVVVLRPMLRRLAALLLVVVALLTVLR
jgi:hypothetical protein